MTCDRKSVVSASGKDFRLFFVEPSRNDDSVLSFFRTCYVSLLSLIISFGALIKFKHFVSLAVLSIVCAAILCQLLFLFTRTKDFVLYLKRSVVE